MALLLMLPLLRSLSESEAASPLGGRVCLAGACVDGAKVNKRFI